MRLAFLTHEPFYPPSGGGSAEAVYLVQEMVRRGWEVHVFGPRLENHDEVSARFGVRLHPFTRWQMGRYTKFRNFKYLAYPFFLQGLVEQSAVQFDLIFSQHAISAVAAGRLRTCLGAPVVMNYLDYLTGFMETWPSWLAPPPALAVLKRFELSMPRRYEADAVLTVSDTLADRIRATGYPSAQIQPIYYGYDASLFPFREPRPWDGKRAPVVVMHGSLDHHHLREIALAAMERVVAEIPTVIWRFVGQRTAALESFLERQKLRVPRAQVECTGFLPYAEVSKELQKADLGIVPYEESSGTHCAFVAKIVEYLATGLPVVSTSIDSALRYFRSEPMVRFAGFEGARFGEVILQTLRQPLPDLTTAAREASQRVEKELDWRVISRKAVDFVAAVSKRRATEAKAL